MNSSVWAHRRSDYHGGTVGRRKKAWYYSYTSMMGRCYNPNDPAYFSYGGRGITVQASWRHEPSRFLSDMGEPPTSGYSLDRINPDGPYAPWNCRWASPTEQSRNRRNSRPAQERWTTLMLEWQDS
jgi:hypothetical protein